MRIYRSISEILTGFDVDCSCAAYDGNQVYASPRALAAYMTQVNTIDLTRRSPSYENRLSKYSHRGFEVYWPLLERSRIDPTIFERSFGRTLGLARLLVLEKLPSTTDREAYVDQRRAERGRPAISRYSRHELRGNMKDDHEDEVAEWVETDEVSDYHTFTIPYGPKYHARNIDRLLYAKDLLLNAEWNRPKERESTLHRHPAFFGNATDVIGDCCGYCPKPLTPEDVELAEEENKIYVSGALSFIKDDPGRQTIGSFHPLTDDDWTEMAYVGNTARLCQAIIQGDLEHVKDWLHQEGADPNQRDYTGRTPLHLAVTSSTPEIVQALIDADARLVARLFDGKTALHLAAVRGETSMVKSLLVRSEANEEREAEKEAQKKAAQKAEVKARVTGESDPKNDDDDHADEDDLDVVEDESEDIDSTTDGSIIRINRQKTEDHENLPDDANEDEPDVYDVNVLAWDAPVSALHLAIANGHLDVVKLLVQEFGADLLLPIKLVSEYSKSPRAAILPVVLALQLSPERAREMTTLLISLGASPAQGDIDSVTALHYFTAHGANLLGTMISADRPAAQRAVNHLTNRHSCSSALRTAIEHGDTEGVDALLELGAKAQIDFATYATSLPSTYGDAEKNFRHNFEQPVLSAVISEQPAMVFRLLDAGADVNSLTPRAWRTIDDGSRYYEKDIWSVLDLVRKKIAKLQAFGDTGDCKENKRDRRYNYNKRFEPIPLKDDAEYLRDYEGQAYTHWSVTKQIKGAKWSYQNDLKRYKEYLKEQKKQPEGVDEKKAAAEVLLAEFTTLESRLVEQNAKTFKELYPDIKLEEKRQNSYRYGYEPDPPRPWNPDVTFRTQDLTNEKRAGYLKLFQAAWDGDLATIKTHTLAIWGDNNTPLKIAVTDTNGLSPFSIAVLRKHWDLAKAIMEIAHAQYAPEETPRAKHTLQAKDEDDECVDNDDEFEIYAEILDDRFTVENIGEVQNQVKSDTTPLQFMSWSCPASDFLEDDERPSVERPGNLFKLAIFRDDADLLDLLLTMGEEYTLRKASAAEEDATRFFHFEESDFLYAIRLGRVRMLESIIKRTGAGVPFDDLVKKSGIEIEVPKKPKWYQGLSVHGQKRADWANAGRYTQAEVRGAQHPPLLFAAQFASLESVEWFSGNAPMRCYSEFASRHADDVQIRNLAKAKDGLEKTVAKWLDIRSHLLIHCVVLSKTDEQSLNLLRYLCKIHPETIHHRSASGLTPLHLAFELHKIEMVRVLLEAGADQTTRNRASANLVHSILNDNFLDSSDLDKTRELLNLIDPRLLPSLFTERTNDSPGAATPLARWIHSNARGSHSNCTDFVQLILDFSKGEDLTIVNGEGDTPVHAAVRYGNDAVLRTMLQYRPELILRENASGRTPFELAQDAYFAKEVFENPPLIDTHGGHHHYALNTRRPWRLARIRDNTALLSRKPETFVEGSVDRRSGAEKVYEVCLEFRDKALKDGLKRKLVSLVEANEVAKRLALRKGGDENRQRRRRDANGEDEIVGDEVAAWWHDGLRGSTAS